MRITNIIIKMAKFKVGDIISNTINSGALSYAEIYAMDDKYYYCRILRGTAQIPIAAESTYEKRKKDARVLFDSRFF